MKIESFKNELRSGLQRIQPNYFSFKKRTACMATRSA